MPADLPTQRASIGLPAEGMVVHPASAIASPAAVMVRSFIVLSLVSSAVAANPLFARGFACPVEPFSAEPGKRKLPQSHFPTICSGCVFLLQQRTAAPCHQPVKNSTGFLEFGACATR
ncbi:hypothetical protein [Rhizobium redzepovicii]